MPFAAKTPDRDDERVAALKRYRILDTPGEERFDRIVREVARRFAVPIAYLAFIDSDRQWLKSTVGGMACEVGREKAFCSHTILRYQPLVIPDTLHDDRFRDHPFVVGEPYVRFYAGVPLTTPEGHNVGTLCVADHRPRNLEPDELRVLQEYAEQVLQKVTAVPHVFLSYSHKDETWKERLVSHLSVLEEQNLLSLWEDRRIDAGEEWQRKILDAIEASNVAVLLVSAHSLSSKFIQGVEVKRILEHRETEGMRIVPVLIADCTWKHVPWLEKLQMRPTGARAIEGLPKNEINATLKALSEEILSLTRSGPGPSPEPRGPAPVAREAPTAPRPSRSEAAAPVPAPTAAPAAHPGTAAAEDSPADDRPWRSLVVLPVRDLSPGGEQEYFCDGMAEDLITSLVKIDGLRVASRSSIQQLKGHTDDPRAIGARFGVDAVLYSSLRTAGNRLRVNVELTKTADGLQLWAERFDREMEDIFEIQSQIAESVAESLKLHVAPGEAGGAGLSDVPLEAHKLYLQGRHFWSQRTESSLEKSLRFFERAIEASPSYARAHQGLASALATLGLFGAASPAEAMPRAMQAARRALELDPDLPEAHSDIGCVQAIHQWSWAESEKSFRQALELDPDNAPALQWFAVNHLVPLRRFQEAKRRLDRARELDPLSPAINASQGIFHYFTGAFDRAVDEFRGTLELQPGFVFAHQFLSQALTELGRHEEADRALEQASRFAGGDTPEMTAMRAYSQARSGDPDRAREALGALAEMAERRYVSPSMYAVVLAAIGDREAALTRLEEAFENRSADLAWLDVRPVYRALREEPRFRSLLEKIGLGGAPAIT